MINFRKRNYLWDAITLNDNRAKIIRPVVKKKDINVKSHVVLISEKRDKLLSMFAQNNNLRYFRSLIKISKAPMHMYIVLCISILYLAVVNIDKFTDVLTNNKIKLLINCNEPEIIGMENYKKIVSNLHDFIKVNPSRENIALGLNIYSPNMNYSYIFDLIKELKLDKIRLSITAPNFELSLDYNPINYYEKMKDITMSIIKEALSNHIMPFYDCNKIPTCLISNEETINKKIFIKEENITKEKEKMFNFLEKQFEKRPLEIGYIETTSVCPYKCKVCPKSSNDLIRKSSVMNLELIKKTAEEIKEQDTVTLHLFGDPFCDRDIYEKIKIINSYNIITSFLTNLVSLNNIDLLKIKDLKVKYFTISVDSIYEDEFEKIRGKSSQESIRKSFSILEELIKVNDRYNCIEEIVVQAINLKIN